MDFLKEDTQVDILFVLVSATDNQTEIITGSPTCKILKPGASTYSNCTNSASHKGNGTWRITLTSSETDTEGFLMFRAELSGAATARREYWVGDLTGLHVADVGASLSQSEQDDLAVTIWRIPVTTIETTSTGKGSIQRHQPLSIIYQIVGYVSDVDGTVTVKQSDNSTTAFTYNLGTDPDADLAISRT